MKRLPAQFRSAVQDLEAHPSNIDVCTWTAPAKMMQPPTKQAAENQAANLGFLHRNGVCTPKSLL